MTEIFSNELVSAGVQRAGGKMSIKFEPSYDSTDEGLLVNRFVAHIGPAASRRRPMQEMDVE